MAITTRSAKNKGARLQKWFAQKISDLTGIPCGKDELIESREMGQAGVDIKLIGEARKKFPFSVETKNQETWSVPAYIKQAKQNVMLGTDWLLVMQRKDTNPVVVMDANAFMRLMRHIDFPVAEEPQRLEQK